ncbi:hypothetical protein D3C80_2124900 [compost metagenome]
MNICEAKSAERFFITLHGQLFVRRCPRKDDGASNDNTIALRRQAIPKARSN